jgi:transcriptional regulator with XRE-family HTH domain
MGTLGQRIEQERKAKGLTQAQLGKYAGIGRSAVCQWEKDRIKNPTAANLLPVALALEVNPEYLLTGKGEKGIKTLNNAFINNVESAKQLLIATPEKPDTMNPNTIENLFNLKCKTKTWIIFLLGNSDNKNMGIDEYLALSKAYEMLGALLDNKRKELNIEKEKM